MSWFDYFILYLNIIKTYDNLNKIKIMKKLITNVNLYLLLLMSITLITSCKKENLETKAQTETCQENKKVDFFIDNEKVGINDARLMNDFKATHIFLGQDNEPDLNCNFSSEEKYIAFLKSKGFNYLEIINLTSADSNLEQEISVSGPCPSIANQRVAAVNPSLMTITAYTDLNRDKYLAAFTGNTKLCKQVWEDLILGMRVSASSSACQNGAMPATIRMYNGCDYSGTIMNVSLIKCQSGIKYEYAISPIHFKNWYNKTPKMIVSSWKFI